MRLTREEKENGGRCGRCLGMGYKGRRRGAKWKIETCRRCGGRGVTPLRTAGTPTRVDAALAALAASKRSDAARWAALRCGHCGLDRVIGGTCPTCHRELCRRCAGGWC